jgi:hypothetical protein
LPLVFLVEKRGPHAVLTSPQVHLLTRTFASVVTVHHLRNVTGDLTHVSWFSLVFGRTCSTVVHKSCVAAISQNVSHGDFNCPVI